MCISAYKHSCLRLLIHTTMHGEGGQVGEHVRLCQTSALVYLYVSASEP